MLDATDAAVVGRFGSVVDLAALSPSMAVCDMTGLLFMFLSATTAHMMATAKGQRDYPKARGMLSDALCLALCCGLAVSAIMLSQRHAVLRLLVDASSAEAIAGPAAAYVTVRALFFPVQLVQLVLSAACFSALKDTVTPLRATATGGLVNLCLDLVLIAGLGLGTVGAAAATVSGQVVAVSFLARALLNSRGFRLAGSQEPPSGASLPPLLPSPLELLSSLRPSRIVPTVKYAAPFMSFQAMQVVLMSIETRMGSAFGALSLAAHQITYSIWRPLICLGDPIMQAAMAMVPPHVAEGTRAGKVRVRELAHAILKVAIGLGMVSGLVGWTLGVCLPRFFTANVGVVKEAVGLTAPMVASIVSLTIWHCNQGLMLATGRAKLLATLYGWNVFYFSGMSYLVLRCGLTLYHSWWVWASMHAIFSCIVSVVLRMPGGAFARVSK